MTDQVTPEASTPEEPAAPVEQTLPSQASQALKLLMDKENEIRQEASRIKEAEVAAQQARQLQELAQQDPLAFLQNQGVSYEDLTRQVLDGNRPDPTAPLKSEIDRLKQQMDKRRQSEEEAARQAAVEEAQDIVHRFVDTHQDKYPLTKQAGMEEAVFQRIHNHLITTGEPLSEADAATYVEEQLSVLVDKLLQLEQVKTRLNPVAPKPQVPQNASATLSNSLSAQTSPRKVEELLPREQSLAMMAQKLKFLDT